MDHRRKQRSVFMALHSVKSLDSLDRKDAYRYFISSLREDIELVSRAVRGH